MCAHTPTPPMVSTTMLLRPVRRLGAVLGGAWSGGPQRTLITLVERAKAFCAADATSNPTQPAIVSGGSGTQAPTAHTYAQLLADSANLANLLLQRAGRDDLNEVRKEQPTQNNHHDTREPSAYPPSFLCPACL